MFPKFDIASVIPSPVERIAVGNVSEEIRPNRAKPIVLNSLLKAKNTISRVLF